MKFLLSLILLVALLTGCDPNQSTTAKRGAHQATATVQIFPPVAYPASKNFLANQAVILKTGSIIEAAAKACQLDPGTISSALEISIIEGTDLLAITAHHDDEDLPKVIVQSVLDTYRAHRQDLKSEGIDSLEQALVAQAKLVKEKREATYKHVVAYGIPYFDGDHPSPLGQTEQEMFESAKEKLVKFETMRDQTKIEIKNLDESSSDDLIRYAAGLDLPENQVNFYDTKYRKALENIRTLRAQGLAENHPDVIQSEEDAKDALASAAEEAIALKAVLKIKLELIDRQIERMREMLNERNSEKTSEEARKRSLQLERHLKAKEEFEEANNALRRLELKIQEITKTPGQAHEFLIIHGWDHD